MVTSHDIHTMHVKRKSMQSSMDFFEPSALELYKSDGFVVLKDSSTNEDVTTEHRLAVAEMFE